MSRPELLPVGTLVTVTESADSTGYARVPYVAKVVGYDMGHTKYHLGLRYMGWSEWKFLKGGAWAFPSECEIWKEEEEL